MRRTASLILTLAATPLLAGCLAKTALDVATAPVKVAGKAADMATTSQSEADEKRGRALRKREERLGALERRYWKLEGPCRSGDSEACAEQEVIGQEMARIRPTAPSE